MNANKFNDMKYTEKRDWLEGVGLLEVGKIDTDCMGGSSDGENHKAIIYEWVEFYIVDFWDGNDESEYSAYDDIDDARMAARELIGEFLKSCGE